MSSKLLEVKDLRMYYRFANGSILKAVDSVSFSIDRGDRLGLVGESGCGKTSLAMTMLGLFPGNALLFGGEIFFEGRNVLDFSPQEWRRYRWAKVSMIFQAAMNALDPVYRVGKQLTDVYRLHNKSASRKEAIKHVKSTFRLAGLPESVFRNYPYQLSGGMKQRVCIAMSLLCNPRLIIADELSTALDVIIQGQIMHEITGIVDTLGLSMILVSHDVSIVAEVCNKIMVMYAGKLVEFGNIVEVFEKPGHPYTVGLFGSFPSIKGPIKPLVGVPGRPPSLMDDSNVCKFVQRCPRREVICENHDPPGVSLGDDHVAYCHFAVDPDMKRVRYGSISE